MADRILLPFHLLRGCIKCGSSDKSGNKIGRYDVATRYYEGVHSSDPRTGYLKRTCRICGYEWLEETHDRQRSSSGVSV